MQLRDLCGARSGDKGDISDLSLFADDETAYDAISAAGTAERVKAHFGELVQGAVLLLAVFRGNERLAPAVNQLLVIGFSLLNFGCPSLFLSSGRDISDNRGVMEVVSTKVGAVAAVLGVLHLANLWGLNAFRR